MNLICPAKPFENEPSEVQPVPRRRVPAVPQKLISIVRFGVFEVDLLRRELRKCGVKIKLQEKPLQILEALLDARGEIVTREQLQARLWPSGTFVDFDQGLNTAIRKLRRALNDPAGTPRYIETIARRGYRFVAPFELLEQLPPSSPPEDEPVREPSVATPPRRALRPHRVVPLLIAFAILAAAAALTPRLGPPGRRRGPAQIGSIAVLPLANLGGGPEEEYFAEGLTDALISQLARLGGLKVISRTSVMHYRGTQKLLPEIARELHVDAIVEGSVQRAGNRIQISAQLIEASTDRQLWAGSYRRRLKDILAVQNAIAAKIARTMEVRLTAPEEKRLQRTASVDPDAYEAWLRGRIYSNRQSADALQKALALFESSVSKDPGFAPAHVAIADSYNRMSQHGDASPRDTFPKAEAAALEALELDDTLAEAHAALAFSRLHYDWDWPGAAAEFQRALALNPGYAQAHHWYSEYLRATGSLDASIEEAARAFALDPLNLAIGNHLADEYLSAGRLDDAMAQLWNILERHPECARTHTLLGDAYAGKRQYREAESEFSKAVEFSAGDGAARAGLASLYGAGGETELARRLLRELENSAVRTHTGSYNVALVHIALGERSRALEWLRKAYDERAGEFFNIRADPRLNPLRRDPAFVSLLRQMGLDTVPGSP